MIKITRQYNAKCLKCKCVPKKLVKIGVFHMCDDCFISQFGDIQEIDPKSDKGKRYYKWVKKYFKKNFKIEKE